MIKNTIFEQPCLRYGRKRESAVFASSLRHRDLLTPFGKLAVEVDAAGCLPLSSRQSENVYEFQTLRRIRLSIRPNIRIRLRKRDMTNVTNSKPRHFFGSEKHSLAFELTNYAFGTDMRPQIRRQCSSPCVTCSLSETQQEQMERSVSHFRENEKGIESIFFEHAVGFLLSFIC